MRLVLAPEWHYHKRRTRTFIFDGKRMPQFTHRYNATWRNERAVEVPIGWSFLSGIHGEKLEVGNVLAHYGYGGHAILDKYEKCEGVINDDIVTYKPPKAVDGIVCISTLEHVGWDEEPQDPPKLLHALACMRSWLAPKGRLLVTSPIGANSFLDQQLREELIHPVREWFLGRQAGLWSEVEKAVALRDARYHRPAHRGGTHLWVAEFNNAAY